MREPIRVALIYGSTREGRFCDTVARWAGAQIAARAEFALEVIDPAAMSLPARHARADGAEVLALSRRIARADAFVVVRDVVSFADVWRRFDGDGELRDPEGARKAMAVMLASLKWWATALRTARSRTPYSCLAA